MTDYKYFKVTFHHLIISVIDYDQINQNIFNMSQYNEASFPPVYVSLFSFGLKKNFEMLEMMWVPTNTFLPKARQSTTEMVIGGHQYSTSGSITS